MTAIRIVEECINQTDGDNASKDDSTEAKRVESWHAAGEV